MNLSPHTKKLLFFIIILGLLNLFSIQLIPAPTIIIALLTLLPAWFFIDRQDFPKLYYLLWMILTFLSLIFLLLYMILTRSSPLVIFPLILVILQIGRVFTISNHRALFQSWLIALSMITIAAIHGYSLFSLILIVPFLFVSVAFLVNIMLLASPINTQRFPSSLVIRLNCTAFLIALIFFLFLPRHRLLNFQYDLHSITSRHLNFASSGFSDTFYLGTFRHLLNDEREALRLDIDSAYQNMIVYLRGDVMDEFDGLSWRKNEGYSEQRALFPPRGTSKIKLTYEASSDYDSSQKRVQYRVKYTGLNTDLVFYIPVLDTVYTSGIPLITDNSKSLRLERKSSLAEYTAISHPVYSSNDLLYEESLPEDERTMYLNIPDIEGLDEIQGIATRIVRESDSDHAKARAISDYLRSTYIYSLRSDITLGKKSLYHFLFYNRKGHCEFFGTAMAVMLRSIGIPSRIAVGFIKETKKNKNTPLIIQNRDAHVWVEAYCDGRGWYQFDPTPPAPLLVETHNIFVTRIIKWFKKISDRTQVFLSDYSTKLQQQIFTFIGSRLLNLSASMPSGDKWITLWSRLRSSFLQRGFFLFILLVLCIDSILVLTYLKFRHRLRKTAERRPERVLKESVTLFRLYKRILRWLDFRPEGRKTTLTLREIAARYKTTHPAFYFKAIEVIDLYYAARYSPQCDTESLENEILGLIRSSPRHTTAT